MIVAEYLPPRPHLLWQLASQMGVRHAIVNAKPEKTGLSPIWNLGPLRQIGRIETRPANSATSRYYC